MSLPEPIAPPTSTLLLTATRRALRPLVRMLMRRGVTFPIVAVMLKDLYVDVATKDVLTDPAARTDSRISLITGVHRKEIRRRRISGDDDAEPPMAVTLAGQIIGRWLALGAGGEGAVAPALPRVVPAGGLPSFESLIAAVTTDIRARAVLDDWLSRGLVTLDAEDRVQLNSAAFIPQPGSEEQLHYFGRNLHDHLAAAAANVTSHGDPPFVDRSVHYDRLTPAVAAQLEAVARDESMRALIEVNRRARELVGDEEPDDAEQQPGITRVNFGVYIYRDDHG